MILKCYSGFMKMMSLVYLVYKKLMKFKYIYQYMFRFSILTEMDQSIDKNGLIFCAVKMMFLDNILLEIN